MPICGGRQVVLGWPDREGRSRVVLGDRANGPVIGYVRAVQATPTQTRYFAENVQRMPLEGTWKTKRAAAVAVVENFRMKT